MIELNIIEVDEGSKGVSGFTICRTKRTRILGSTLGSTSKAVEAEAVHEEPILFSGLRDL